MSIDKLYQYDRGKVGIGGPRNKVIVLHHLKRVLEKQGYVFDDERDNKSVWSTEELFVKLDAYKRSKLPSPGPSKRFWKQAYASTLEAFGCKEEKLRPLEETELLGAIKTEKSAGLPTLRKKGDVYDIELRRMARINERKCAPPPCIAYHRVQHGDKGPKTRLVWGYPLSMTLLEARFASPLIERFLKLETPMAFGHRKMDLWARMTSLMRNESILALDYSGFDSTCTPELITMAFTVLGTWFTAEEKKALGWETIIHYFIHTPILMPDGWVYKKHVGIPSGSFFTQLVGSIINYFAAMYVSHGLGWDVEVLVLGDDSLIAVKGDVDWSLCKRLGYTKKVFISVVFGELELKVNASKTRWYFGRSREAVHFLGHVWSRGFPHRDKQDIVRRAVYPERYFVGLNSREVERLRIMGLLGDAVESWRVFRDSFFRPSRYGVVVSTFLEGKDLPVPDMGWYRHLEISGHRVTAPNIAYRGLLI